MFLRAKSLWTVWHLLNNFSLNPFWHVIQTDRPTHLVTFGILLNLICSPFSWYRLYSGPNNFIVYIIKLCNCQIFFKRRKIWSPSFKLKVSLFNLKKIKISHLFELLVQGDIKPFKPYIQVSFSVLKHHI